MAKLILRGADGSTRETPLDPGGSVTIGRSPECQLPIDDTQASRRHCTVIRVQSGYELSDLGSTNGTTVNSTLVKKRKLQHGDVIRIGGTEIVYHDPEAGGASPEPQECCLVFARGERKGVKIPLSQQRTTVGRKETNTVVLNDPVASSYHCEIVRDLNGYTIRDLGSTNGTLVNGETVTEAQLTHGAKIRIGNSRFVFQDPAMSEIDLELAGVEDEEPEWGMIRELDLAAVRKRRPAAIVYTVLFVLILGGGGWLLTQQGSGKGTKGPVSPAGNLVGDFSFESVISISDWEGEPAGAVTHELTRAAHGEGESALEVKFREGGGALFHRTKLAGKGVLLGSGGTRYALSCKLGASAGRARLGIQWSGLRASRWSFVAGEAASGKSLRAIEGGVSSPPWAVSARLGFAFDGEGTAWIDDVVLLATGAAQTQETAQNDFQFFVTDGNAVDVLCFRQPILVNGRALAWDAGGAETGSAQVAIEPQDEDHLLVTVKTSPGSGASRCGLELEDLDGHLARDFRAFGTSDDGETFYRGGLPEDGGLDLTGVRKLLVGGTGRAFAVLGAGADDRLATSVRRSGDRVFWSVHGAPDAEGALRFRIKTGLKSESQEAGRQIARSLALHQSGRMGEFVKLAQETLGEFPFADAQARTALQGHRAAAVKEFNGLARDAQESLKAYDTFRDLASLDAARQSLATMRDRFQVTPGQGEWGELYKRLADEENTRRESAEARRQEAQAAWILERARFHLDQGEANTAAVFLADILWYLPKSPQAADAKQLLDGVRASHPHVAKVLDQIRGDVE